jgi:hypothetical protein
MTIVASWLVNTFHGGFIFSNQNSPATDSVFLNDIPMDSTGVQYSDTTTGHLLQVTLVYKPAAHIFSYVLEYRLSNTENSKSLISIRNTLSLC